MESLAVREGSPWPWSVPVVDRVADALRRRVGARPAFCYTLDGDVVVPLARGAFPMEDAFPQLALSRVWHYRVSTVFLGVRQGIGVMPMTFETMTFGPHHSEVNGPFARYSTKAAALAGHRRLVRELRAHLRQGGVLP
jgi:hypothetical protein